MAEHNMLYLLENKNRPGPKYYDDCKKFNWGTAMLISHQKYIGEKGENYDNYALTKEDLEWRRKLYFAK